MKFGFRVPSLKKRIAARTSWKRIVRHNLGLKAPRGLGIITDPKKAVYNKIYNKTTFGIGDVLKVNLKKGKEASGPEDVPPAPPYAAVPPPPPTDAPPPPPR